MKKKEFRILSVDGGGIRGLIPALFLSNIEGRLQKPLYEYFDLICGTSTGGFITLAAASGIKMKDLVSLYENKGPLIFSKSYSQKAKNLFHDMVLYDSKVLVKELAKLFKTKKMSDLKTNVVITTSNVTSKKAKVFKTPHKIYYPVKGIYDEDKDLYIKDVALATSAAPYYLKQKKIKNEIFWDGGLWANNPAICGLIEAKKMNEKLLPLKILSLGTGSIQSPGIKIRKTNLTNPVFAITYMMDIQALAIADQIKMLIDTKDIYKRVDCSFDKGLPMDDISIIEQLKTAAHIMTHKDIEETVKLFFYN